MGVEKYIEFFYPLLNIRSIGSFTGPVLPYDQDQTHRLTALMEIKVV